MGGILNRAADQEVVRQIAKKSASAATQKMDQVADQAVRSAGNLGQDTFVRGATKAAAKNMDPGLYDAIVNPTILREINDRGVTPKLAELPYLIHDPALVPTKSEARVFGLQMTHNAPKVSEALKSLSTGERETYHTLFKMMDTRPDGQLALQNMLMDGKLTIASNIDPKRNLISALGDLSHQELAPGIDRHTLLAQVHQEVADPVSISQEGKGTCAATSHGQVLLALKAPTDYVELVAGLASPEGKAKLADGTLVSRKPDWRAGNDRLLAGDLVAGHPYNQGRSLSSQLIEPAFMQVGMGKTGWYSNTLDQFMANANKAEKVADGGLYGEQSARLMDSLFPNEKNAVIYPSEAALKESYQGISKKEWGGPREAWNKNRMMDYLASNASPQTPVAADVDYQMHGGHALLVTGMKDMPVLNKAGKDTGKTVPGVEYVNPWGRLEVQRADAFKTVLTGLEVTGASVGVVVH